MSIIARRYALALMNLAAKEKQVESVATALDEFAATVAGSTKLQAFLSEPKVTLVAKEQVVTDVLAKSSVPALVSTFLRFITRKRRIGLLEEIRAAYHELADERMGRAKAQVTVAAALSAEQEQSLRKQLEALSGKQVLLQVQVDEAILGGMVARIGSTVWDGSLRNQLSRIQQSIMKG